MTENIDKPFFFVFFLSVYVKVRLQKNTSVMILWNQSIPSPYSWPWAVK